MYSRMSWEATCGLMPAGAQHGRGRLMRPNRASSANMIRRRRPRLAAAARARLTALSRRFARQQILLVLDGAPNHRSGQLVIPDNISLLFLPPYAPELNPKENLWDEIREKIFKNYALKSIDAVHQRLEEAILYIERNPKVVKSITSFPCIAKSF